MPLKTVYKGEVQYLQILDENGNLDAALAKDTLSDADVKFLYEQMVIARAFDEAAFKLQRSGRMGTFPQNKGQEAVALGAAKALRKNLDHIVPSYRENAALFLHGLPMHYIFLHWMGDERGNAVPKGLALSPISVVIGAQTLHAAGIAWAFKLRKEAKAVVCFFGDGAASEGDFHEALNFASALKLPVVFTCVNNHWAISCPASKQTGSKTFAQKALAYDIPTLQIDGNDIFACYKAHRDAAERARSGAGPSFIEAVTYRLADHTTADDARRYRPDAEYQAALARDPLIRIRKFLQSKKLWDDAQQTQLDERAKTIVRECVDAAINIEKPQVGDIFDFTFAELPDELARQKETIRTDSLGQDPAQIGLKASPESTQASH